MFADRIEFLTQGRYADVFTKIAEFYRKEVRLDMPIGRYEIEGDQLLAIVSHYSSKPLALGQMETHIRYADMQMVLQGREFIHFCPKHILKEKTAYDADADIAFFETPKFYSSLLLEPGYAAVFLPEDGHMPQIQVNDSEPIIKIVFKIAAEKLH